MKFLVINDFNDINDASIRHFSLDKGHFLAKSIAKNGHNVYFMTIKNNYNKNGISYISIHNINNELLDSIDYVLIIREPLLINILQSIPAIKSKMAIPSQNRIGSKFIIKSDAPLWISSKNFISGISEIFGIPKVRRLIHEWVCNHIDYICVQNENFMNMALKSQIPSRLLILSNMGITSDEIDYQNLINPYFVNHEYCVNGASQLGIGKALLPLYYVKHPEELDQFNTMKIIIIYTGRVKTNGGNIFYNMKNIMYHLGEKYELHIFPGSFFIPDDGDNVQHSGKNASSLVKLRDTVFNDSKNVIIHFPYEHEDKYRYLHFAHCGIDFSDVRPTNTTSNAGHAKILEYCQVGIPVVCEENVQNLFLLRNGKNGMILPYLATDEEYADAIKKMTETPINRNQCRNITVQNENWDKRAQDMLKRLTS